MTSHLRLMSLLWNNETSIDDTKTHVGHILNIFFISLLLSFLPSLQFRNLLPLKGRKKRKIGFSFHKVQSVKFLYFFIIFYVTSVCWNLSMCLWDFFKRFFLLTFHKNIFLLPSNATQFSWTLLLSIAKHAMKAFKFVSPSKDYLHERKSWARWKVFWSKNEERVELVFCLPSSLRGLSISGTYLNIT